MEEMPTKTRPAYADQELLWNDEIGVDVGPIVGRGHGGQ
jgi:hypothetical protein